MDKERLKAFCRSLGLTEVGVAPCRLPVPDPLPEVCPLAAGKGPERYDLSQLLPGCRAAVVALFPYFLEPVKGSNLSLYCQLTDYHKVVPLYLEKIAGWLQAQAPESRQMTIVDTSPLAERDLAVQAGVGFLGDNGCLINETYGSWCFVGAVLTTVPLTPDQPRNQECLHCGSCSWACPGDCFQSGRYDYRSCKSYLTQKKGELTAEETAIIQKTPLIFGCDACQDCCPHNARAKETPLPEFRQERIPRLEESTLEAMTNRQFREAYGDRSFAWRGKKILLRNLELTTGRK
ncbi:epoxyqueuosine reductase [Acidaminococcus sp. LBK-2]|uniref:epoxyqueuosine reductase n=1 Tax=Acidaminococcus sp. LBK-2 TaxID=3456956 RepID=UPI003FA4BEDD